VSSTTSHNRDPVTDFYRTPQWPVTSLYEAVPWLAMPTLDPCAGDGSLVASGRVVGSAEMRGVELHEGRVALAQAAGVPVMHGDGLRVSWTGEHILMNPPFANAMDWLVKGVAEATSVVCFLRIGFLSGQKRMAFWQAHRPNAIVIMSARAFPDSADYIWACWDKRIEPGAQIEVRWITK